MADMSLWNRNYNAFCAPIAEFVASWLLAYKPYNLTTQSDISAIKVTYSKPPYMVVGATRNAIYRGICHILQILQIFYR